MCAETPIYNIDFHIELIYKFLAHTKLKLFQWSILNCNIQYATRASTEKTVKHSVNVGEDPRSVTTSRGVSVVLAGGERRVMMTSTSVTAVRVLGKTRSVSTHLGPSGVIVSPGSKTTLELAKVYIMLSGFYYGRKQSSITFNSFYYFLMNNYLCE